MLRELWLNICTALIVALAWIAARGNRRQMRRIIDDAFANYERKQKAKEQA